MHLDKTTSLLCLILFLGGHSLYPSALADTVVLKNGKKFEGIVKKETPAIVTVDIGLGTISFNRDQIAKVERSENQVIEENWQREFFSRGKFVPDGLHDFAEKFAALESSRNTAARVRGENSRIQRRRTELFNEINSIQNEISEIAAQFQSVVPEKNIQKYNSLVKHQNRLASRVVLINDKLQQDYDQSAANLEIISAYMEQLADFKNELALKKTEAKDQVQDAGSKTAGFFSSIEQRIEQYSTEFQQIEVPHQGAQDHMLVTVRVNDRIDGLFLLDTGATYVTLSSEMARNLGLGLSGKSNISVSLANGSSVSAQPVILDSMQAGDAKVHGVIAMVFPESPHDGVDGLLGMSFLREFTIQMDPVNKKLVFQKFAPN
ncbi:MAG: TIGR02281 family clan AA aspartic protease [Methylococcaceae bacterium]|nr:TIGR02281 family clan AA aspartic protease [Methylococcaceae bacterium]